MTEMVLRSLTQLSEAGRGAILPGDLAASCQGPVFQRLLGRRVIVEQAHLTHWDVCDACDCDLPFRQIRTVAKAFQAECPLDRRRDVVLFEEDLRVFSIDAAKLAAAISSVAGLDAEPAPVADGVWRLGSAPSGRTVFLALEARPLSEEGMIALLRQTARGKEIAILAPKLSVVAAGALEDAGFHLIATLAVLVPGPGPFGASIEAGAFEPVSRSPKLRVQTETGEVSWLGRSVFLSHQLFPVFRRLIDKALTGDPIASGPHLEGGMGREAKDLIREMRDAFKAAGFTDEEAKNLIMTRHNRGYFLAAKPADILING